MSPLPDRRPQQMSLGPLETEILNIVWNLSCATVKQVHEYILADPDRELAYTSVTTVLRRLTQKGWLVCDDSGRAFVWRPLVSRREAQMLRAHQQLNKFLEVGNPDVVAAFADSLDSASIEQIEAIAEKLKAIRKVREEKE
ncbi:MAG: BlaI/MecI/CopY family transcriptional regulator [Cyanobacteriota bacterium]|nr:BlaI/MecI/CopY family transcriptional regulator [Cyanobacteriota bacterium]